jgi:hypothetical protein
MSFEVEMLLARQMALEESLGVRTELAKAGMCARPGIPNRPGRLPALDQFEIQSKVGGNWSGRSRWWDGLKPIDQAVAELKRVWSVQRAAVCQPEMEALLLACRNWLDQPNLEPSRLEAVRTLYWESAWAYSTACFVKAASDLIERNRDSDTPTSFVCRELLLLPYGNPYTAKEFRPMVRRTVYRGDTRNPQAVRNGYGFVSRNYTDVEKFIPFWDGFSQDTQSTTAFQYMAVNACGALRKGFSRQEPGPAEGWLAKLIEGEKHIGFVYETFTNGATGLEVNVQAEDSFLAIPWRSIHRFWVALGSYFTIGPFAFPQTQNPPANGSFDMSEAQYTLHGTAAPMRPKTGGRKGDLVPF